MTCDASHTGYGAFLYQVKCVPRTEENRKKFLEEFGYVPEPSNHSAYLLPGVVPGKNTPCVLNFSKNKNDIDKLLGDMVLTDEDMII